jgi:hypothetical protein
MGFYAASSIGYCVEKRTGYAVPAALHYGLSPKCSLRPDLAGGDGKRLLRRAAIAVFAEQQKRRVTRYVDPADPIGDVAVDLCRKIAFEASPFGLPGPPGLPLNVPADSDYLAV